VPNLIQVQGTSNTTDHGGLLPSRIQRRGYTTGRDYAQPSHYNWEAEVTSTKQHLRRTLRSHIATNEKLLHYLLRYRPV